MFTNSQARVLCIPMDHPFIAQALPADRLAGVPMTARQSRGWELSPAFDSAWLAAHRHAFDAVHLHFGFETVSVERLTEWVETLRTLEIPLIVTVHDLRNPHQAEPQNHGEQLAVLLAAAREIVTLTSGAAEEITGRFARLPRVVAHPPLIPAPEAAPRSAMVGITLKARAQVCSADDLVMAALDGVERARRHRAETTLRVEAHPDWLPRLPHAAAAAAAGRLALLPLERADEGAFVAKLTALDVCVLPYRFGTHSGWLEACRDVGTKVVAPDCGYYAQQWADIWLYGNNELTGFDAGSLTDAVVAAVLSGSLAPATSSAERVAASRTAYREVYDRALAAA